jgi:hypothetical protein
MNSSLRLGGKKKEYKKKEKSNSKSLAGNIPRQTYKKKERRGE